MSDNLLSLAGWYFLPNLVTGWAQSAFYAVWIRAGDPKPQPGTLAFVKHRRRINIVVILAYLLYTIYEADFQLRQAGNFYQHLGVGLDVDDRGLNSRFRRLTLLHHPDKVPDHERNFAESYYIHLKLCRDTLIDPAKRFAYDRLGPEILSWNKHNSIADYIAIGIRNLVVYYTGTAGVLVLLGVMGYIKQAAFWRFLALGCLGVFELHVLTSTTFPRVLTKVVNPVFGFALLRHPPFLPYQLVSLLRKLVLTLFIAFSQIGPLLGPLTPQPPSEDEVSQQQLQRTGQLAVALENEANMLMGLEMTPFAGDEGGMRDLRARMKRFLVDNTVRSNKEVRDAMGEVIARKRQGVPHGAVGTR